MRERQESAYKVLLRNTGTYCRFRYLIPVVRAEAATADGQTAVAGELRQPGTSVSPVQLITKQHVEQYIANEDGATRVKNIFKKNPVGDLHPDLKLIMLGTSQAAIVTFLFGYLIGARQGGEYYKYRHQAAKYETRFMAMRSYYDSVIVGGVAHGFRYAVKIGLFTGIFMTTSQCIATYRNKSSPWECAAGGAITGGLLRSGLGFRGIIAGGILGGGLGLIGGLILWGAMSAGEERQQDRYFKYVQELLLEKRRLQTIQAMSTRKNQNKVESSTS